MMKRADKAGAVVLCFIAFGCAESTVIRSIPPGARLYVNDRLEGTTPTEFTVSREEFSTQEFRVRLEREGYEPTQQVLRKQTCAGRIVGGVFSLGISLLFKRPTCFSSPQTFALPLPPAETHPPPAPGEAEGRPLTINERLERLNKMREQGLISEKEYEHSRREILKGL